MNDRRFDVQPLSLQLFIMTLILAYIAEGR